MTGFFDSGVGGVSIMKAFLECGLDQEVVYFADNQAGMIGSKSHQSILNTTKFAIEYLASQGCETVYLACNTASANTMIDLDFASWKDDNFPDLIINNVITPTLDFLLKLPSSTKITILATPSTINSGVYQEGLHSQGFDSVFGLATVDLARAVEDLDYERVRLVLQNLFLDNSEFIRDTEVMVLSCTHYTWVKKTIAKIFEDMFYSEIKIISQNKICFDSHANKGVVLELENIDEGVFLKSKNFKVKVVTTDSETLKFAQKAQTLLNN
jgi:glutamate racemase